MARRRSRWQGKEKKRHFFIALAVIILISILAWTGMVLPQPGGGKVRVHGVRDIRLGIDIRGGVEAIYAPEEAYDEAASVQQLDAIVEIMERRLDSLNILDREIYPVPEQGRVIVRFPWQSGESSFNPDEAMKELGATAQLTFKDPDGTVIITGADVTEASAGVNPQNNQNVVMLNLNAEGAEKFREGTARLVGQTITTYMDDEIINEATVQQVISGGEAVISGLPDAESAVKLADSINAGALPFSIVPVSSSSISPTLGAEALDIMVRAGFVSFLVLSLFLTLYYRLPGFVAMLTLWAQALGILLAISIPQQTLTLQGIAGVILSIGMGVDANIIIAERIKEEVRKGTSVKTSLYYGFDRAFSSILDGNVTVAIAAVALMIFGTGSLLSFGYSLLAGVILNLLCGAYLSQFMMRSLATFEPLARPWLYGAPRGSRQDVKVKDPRRGFSFFKNRYRSLIVTGVLLVIGIVAAFVNGIQLDIQFRGGSILTYRFEGEIDQPTMEAQIEETIGRGVTIQETVQIADQQKSLVVSVAGDDALPLEEQTAIRQMLATEYPDHHFQVSDVNVVNPAIGRETLLRGVQGLLIAAVLIVLYVWFRFRAISGPSAGIFALGALLHDILIAFFVFVVLKQALNDTVIAVVLSILGWSVNDTIVIYDRIRENARLYRKEMSLPELTDMSIRQSLTRTINTSVASFIVMAIAYIYALVNGIGSIQAFALPMMVGIVVGSFTSIALTSPFWAAFKSRKHGGHAAAEVVGGPRKPFFEIEEDGADPAAEEAVRRASKRRR